MDDTSNYPSCIKIPTATSTQNIVSPMVLQKSDIEDALTFNSALISVANRLLGEGKWSHTVTNQTIDFVEAFMGKYVCGCVTFVKIELQNGIFHEDMGYCHAEGAVKGLAIHRARIGSLTDAFKKVLTCFGIEVLNEVHKLSRKLPNLQATVKQKEDVHYSLANAQANILEPCAQSIPIISRKNDEQKDKQDNASRPKSPNVPIDHMSVQQTMIRSKSPTEQSGQSILSKPSNYMKCHIQSNGVDHQKEQDNIKKEQESKKVLTEDLLRLERKRKQMEKQAEYKRRMKEREQKKSNEDKNVDAKH